MVPGGFRFVVCKMRRREKEYSGGDRVWNGATCWREDSGNCFGILTVVKTDVCLTVVYLNAVPSRHNPTRLYFLP